MEIVTIEKASGRLKAINQSAATLHPLAPG